MTAPFAGSFPPEWLMVTVVAIPIMFLAVVAYALRTKGNVRAVLSHGKTVLELEAKEPEAKVDSPLSCVTARGKDCGST